MEYEKIEKNVREILSEKRFNHSIGVAKKAEELAKRYGEDTNIAKIIGIAHDIAKEMSDEEYFEYVRINNIQIDDIEKNNPKLLHAKVGADICKKRFGFNEQMQNAIKYHTTGSVKMDNMAKIIYLADKIEDGRAYEGVEIAREKTNISIDEGMLYLLSRGIKKSLDKDKLIHKDSVDMYNKLILLMGANGVVKRLSIGTFFFDNFMSVYY